MAASWTVSNRGADLAVFEYGRCDSSRTVVLVHGYPDDHRMFLPMIAEIGDTARVITYDTRAAGASVVYEPRLSAFRIENLASDLVAVVESIPDRRGPVRLFAHDWGSVQAWEALSTPDAPEMFSSYVSVSGPSLDHLRTYYQSVLTRPAIIPAVVSQLAHSWYVFGFQIPVVRRAIPALLDAFRGSETRPPTTAENRKRGMMLYRANILRKLISGSPPRCAVPTTIVVPTRDRFLVDAVVTAAATWIETVAIRRVDAHHWWPYAHAADAAALAIGE